MHRFDIRAISTPRTLRGPGDILVLGALALALACGGGGDGSGTTGDSSTSTTSTTTTDPSTTGDPPTTGLTTEISGTESDSLTMTTATGPTTTEPVMMTESDTTTAPDTTSGSTSGTTGDDTTSGSSGTTGDDTTSESGDTTSGTTGDVPPECVEEVAQSFVPTGLTLDLTELGFLQTSWYDPVADKICFFSATGKALCFTPEGAPLGTIQGSPVQATDGGVYDAVSDKVLTIGQSCLITELDPITLLNVGTIQLDVQKYGFDTCSGIALTPIDNNLYIASYFTNEILTITRDGQTELDRFSVVPAGIKGPDGINVISGSGDLLIMGTFNPKRTGIVGPTGETVVMGSLVGGVDPPIKGGVLSNPDDTLTLCETGHVWVCDNVKKCTEYMPEDGDKNICGCFEAP